MSSNAKPIVEYADVLRDVQVSVVQDDAGKALYPVLVDLLTPRHRDGKMTRQGGRLSFKAESGSWRMQIECPTEGVQCSVVISSLETALAEMEDAILSKRANWEQTWARKKKELTALAAPVQ